MTFNPYLNRLLMDKMPCRLSIQLCRVIAGWQWRVHNRIMLTFLMTENMTLIQHVSHFEIILLELSSGYSNCMFKATMSIINVPKYLKKLIYTTEDLNSLYRSDKCERNRIQYELVNLALKKIFRIWHTGDNCKAYLESYIRRLVIRGTRYRLCSKVGQVDRSQIKYEATQAAILILLRIYQKMDVDSIIWD